jgi:hypothetical protein
MWSTAATLQNVPEPSRYHLATYATSESGSIARQDRRCDADTYDDLRVVDARI